MILGRWAAAFGCVAAAMVAPAQRQPLGIVVMDPLCKRLACACVKGYAQRDYEALGSYLSRRMGRPVRMIYSDDLAKALDSARKVQVLAIVGKDSVVRADSEECRIKVRPVAALTDEDGSETITGWFVVRKNDPAKTIADLKGRRIFFGPKDNEEKYGAALKALQEAGVPRPKRIETRPGCSDAAQAMLESKDKPAPAALISSYAATLIEGCGQVPKAALRVVGKTAPVPFVTVFATSKMDESESARLATALFNLSEDPYLLAAMETKGFVPVRAAEPTPLRWTHPFVAKPRPDSLPPSWPGWRGPSRDGAVASLPRSLPSKPRLVWRQPLCSGGMSGVAVADDCVIVPDRDPNDGQDVFRCFRAGDGSPVWKVAYPTVGRLDYGNAPRATPQIDGKVAYLLGAFGRLSCVDLATGKVVWNKDLSAEFGTRPPTWGYAGSPLILDDLVIASPGAKASCVVALDKRSGAVRWKSKGHGASYSSFVGAMLGGRSQIVGYDSDSLGGWDPITGERIWTLVPETPGDYNIGTPIVAGGGLLVATERNGARLYRFEDGGRIVPKPVACDPELAPDTITPVLSGDRVLGCRGELVCLDHSLKRLWSASDPAFRAHVSLIASPERVLISTYRGELLLVATQENRYRLISRVRVAPADRPFYSHPALVGDRLFLRDATGISCLDLGE